MAACIVCGQDATLQPGFEALMRVTSDSRIWPVGGSLAVCQACETVQKPYTPEFAKDAAKIYETYQLFFQSSGKEQKLFTGGQAIPRSELLYRQLLPHLVASMPLTVLDIGCGMGNLLETLHRYRPEWKLYGADLHETHRARIESIGGVEAFFSGEIAGIKGKFDVIFLSHVLEHIATPVAFLKQVQALLNPKGMLIVLVPDATQNPFDILVADHCLHFSKKTLGVLLARAGFSVKTLQDGTIPKEIFACCQVGDSNSKQVETGSEANGFDVRGSLDWVQQLCRWAMAYSSADAPIGVFGTALAATWLTHAAGLSPAFFVDEDVERQGQSFLGKPVFSPAQVPEGALVLVPLPSAVASQVAERLNRIHARDKFIPPFEILPRE